MYIQGRSRTDAPYCRLAALLRAQKSPGMESMPGPFLATYVLTEHASDHCRELLILAARLRLRCAPQFFWDAHRANRRGVHAAPTGVSSHAFKAGTLLGHSSYTADSTSTPKSWAVMSTL